MHSLLLLYLFACTPDGDPQQDTCPGVPTSFIQQMHDAVSDTTGRFFNDYPEPTSLTCEMLVMLQDEMKNDSMRHHVEHLHQRYGDPRASLAFSYIERQMDFHLPMLLLTHWNPDVRINALRSLQAYRRFRPLVCTTKEGNAQLERQDRAAVRYLLRVLETTPMGINGSENATIHDIYIREVMSALDLFTRTEHVLEGDQRMRVDMSQARFQQAMKDWRKWLGE